MAAWDDAGGDDPGPCRRAAGSGRVLVAASVLAVLAGWGGLDLVFRRWRAEYRDRAAFGARVVAGAVDPLAKVVPADGATAPGEWREAVARTHAMLAALTAANLLDRPAMAALGASVSRRVAAATPADSRATLAGLWDEVAAKAGPAVIARHPRPATLDGPHGRATPRGPPNFGSTHAILPRAGFRALSRAFRRDKT